MICPSCAMVVICTTCSAQKLHDHTLEVLEKENAALREEIRAMRSEYICTCGIRVTPHKCLADTGF